MDSVFKLIGRAIGNGFGRKLGYAAAVALLAFASQCHGMGTVTPTSQETIDQWRAGSDGAWFNSSTAACNGFIAQLNIDAPTLTWRLGPSGAGQASPWTCNHERRPVNAQPEDSWTQGYANLPTRNGPYGGPACPANAGVAGSGCQCNAGFVPNGGATACTTQPVCSSVATTLNASPSTVLYVAAGGGPYVVCTQGCTMTGAFSGTDASGTYVAGPFTSGAACNGATGSGSDNSTPAFTPSPGKCPGTVNGVTVSVDCGSMNAPGPSTAASGVAGAASGGQGNSSTSSTTVCTGNSCTTTTNVYGSGGGLAGTSDKTQEKGSFCAENPGLSICKETTVGGSCSAITCGGDAVQCAILRDQAARNCVVFDIPSTSSAAGLAAAAGGIRPTGHPGLTPTVVSLANGFDQTEILAGSCPADVPVPLNIAGGRVIWLRFSELCAPAAILGNVLLGITALACLGIVFLKRG